MLGRILDLSGLFFRVGERKLGFAARVDAAKYLATEFNNPSGSAP